MAAAGGGRSRRRERPTPSRPRRAAFAAITALAGGAVVLVATEIVLRRTAATDAHHVWAPGESRVFHPHPAALPGISGPARFVINADGMRGDAFGDGDTYRVLTIGGSATEGLYLDETEAWPRLLQDELNRRLGTGSRVRVGNVGKSGHTTRHHVLQVERLLPRLRAVDEVIVLAGVNDFLRRLARDDAWRPADPLAPATRAGLVREAFAVHPGWDADFPWHKRTELWRRARALLGSRTTGVVQDDAGEIFIRLRRFRSGASAMRTELPDLDAALAEFAANVARIGELARRHGARPVFLTQPALWRPDLPAELRGLLWCGGVGSYFGGSDAEYYSVEALAEGLARYNRRLLEACREARAGCYDLASALPADGSVFYDDVHFNENGSRLVARRLAALLEERAGARVRDASGRATR